MTTSDRNFFIPLSHEERLSVRLSGWIAFVVTLLTYWLTVAPSASYWDCPEYILTAVRLEVGHPPGNPFWTLFHRFVTIPFGADKAAPVINMTSGLFTALSVMLLARMVCVLIERVCINGRRSSHLAAVTGALTAALIFGWCDSAWYSAVEAEVYAMSLFLTALTLWLMLRRAWMPEGVRASRVLLLTAYLTGLSLGVHQLNLLSLPVLALIYVWRRSPGRVSAGRLLLVLCLSFAAIIFILKGMMPGTVWCAAAFELFAVDILHLPYTSGVIAYLAMLLLSGALLLIFLHDSRLRSVRIRRFAAALSMLVFLLLSSYFYIGGRGVVSLGLSILLTWYLLLSPWRPSLYAVRMIAWGGVLLLIGYSSLLLIPVRSAASPYLNTGFPSDPFTLYSYIEREQYGGAPLLRGRTPYSQSMYMEETAADSSPKYNRYALRREHPVWRRAVAGGRLSPRSGFVTTRDSLESVRRLSSGEDSYLLSDYRYSRITTPELDMWLPRITSGNTSDKEAYRSWVGMDTSTMTRVSITEAFDSAGKPVTRRGADGTRHPKWSYRPTYLQNLQYFLGYQSGYMYFRYLLWNFSGRQNDIPSSGEADHGNFLTCIPLIDDSMLGPQASLPAEAREGNRGYNRYWMLPLLLSLCGIVMLMRAGRSGRRVSFGIMMLFLLTGLAIVVYLNQTGSEPRERDYTFLCSYLAFAAWGGFGAAGIIGLFRKRWRQWLAAVAMLGVPVLMFAQNYDDHDRSGRHAATDFACNILRSLPADAILFTDGDNYTFPLWYAQEVLGVRRDVTVVSVAYMALPQYVASLRIPGEESRPVAMTAEEADLVYGRYAFSRFPSAECDTAGMESTEFMKRLYSSPSPVAILPSSRVDIVVGKDTIDLNLRTVAAEGGSSMIGQRQLAMIDIVATNARQESPRPVCWISSLPPRSYSGFMPWTESYPFVRVLRNTAAAPPSVDKILSFMKWGGLNSERPPYIDPTVQGMVSGQRVALIREGRRLLEQGQSSQALRLAYCVADSLPQISPFVGAAVEGKLARDGIEMSLLLIEAGEEEGDNAAVERGRVILSGELERIEEWRRWRSRLNPRLRQAVSYSTLRLLSIDTDSLARRGGLSKTER